MRKAAIAALVLLAVVVVHDLRMPSRDAWGANAAISAIDSYRSHLSPLVGRHVTCRFVPTCSSYGREAIRKYGLARGGARAALRIARCGPWTKAGTVDRP